MPIVLTTKQRIERDTFDRIVEEKTRGKSLIVPHHPSFADYNGDLFFSAVRKMDFHDKRILEIGCGSGEISTWFALGGALHVLGVDISGESIRIAKQRARDNGCEKKVDFLTCPGESIPQPNSSFDVIFINVALHHLDLAQSVHECHRLLSPGGSLIAIEPLVRSHFIQKLRELPLIQKFYPIRRESETEKILTMQDIELIKSVFGHLELIPHRIFSPFIFKAKPIFHGLTNLLFFFTKDPEQRKQQSNRFFQRIDNLILRVFPFLCIASRYSIVVAQKDRTA